MAKSISPKQEKFCRLYVELGNASEAYRQSYSCKKITKKTVNEAACRLAHRANIAARIAEIQSGHAEEHAITVEWLTTKYLETFEMACKQGKASEAKGVLDSLGKLHGHMVEKKQVNGNIQHNHSQEPVSATLEWIRGAVGESKTIEAEESLPN